MTSGGLVEIEHARRMVLARAARLPAEDVPVASGALDRVLAEGVKSKSIGERNFEAIVGRGLVRDVVTVSESELKNALRVAWKTLKLAIEPTAALSPVEVKRLFNVVATLRAHGTAVLFISHRLGEVFEICQRVTVLRDGRLVFSQGIEGLSPDDLVRAMVGRDVLVDAHEAHQVGDRVLEVDRLTREGVFLDVSFEVRAGEVVALAGLVGAGRSEVARAIFGIDRYDAGSVKVSGRALRRGSPTAAMTAGIGFVPEDRRQQGLVMELSIARNIALASLRRLTRVGLLSGRTERSFAADWAQRLQVKYRRITSPVTFLSGGNQQKVVLAKWLSRKPALLIVDEPTRGIDIGTKAEVHRLIASLARDGVAVLMISSELPEVLSVADRILVMHEGRLAAELTHDEATEEAIVAAATGQRSANGKPAGTSL